MIAICTYVCSLGETGLEYSIVHVTGTSPFAGLVMTDSQKRDQDQDQDKSETDTGLDTGNPELWDSVQAEQEWSQVKGHHM